MSTYFPHWMQYISDETNLTELSIPGSHDSATKGVSTAKAIWAKTQDYSIGEQLVMGIRFLDIRLNLAEPNLRIYHGTGSLAADCHLNFDEFIEICKIFLATYSSETIIVSVKEEGSWANFDETIRAAIIKDGNLWYRNESFPKLGDVRGKLVLIRRWSWKTHIPNFGIDASPIYWNNDKIPFYISASKMCVQDDWDVSATSFKDGIDKKVASVGKVINLARGNPEDGIFYLNFLSAHGGAWGSSPRTIAVGTSNQPGMLKKTLDIVAVNPNGSRFGTLLLDFVGSTESTKLISNLISNNTVSRWPSSKETGPGIQTDKFPTCCVYNNVLHIIWASVDKKHKIWLSASKNGEIYSSPYNPEYSNEFLTPNGVGSCVLNDRLYMFWRANDYGNWIWHSYMNKSGIWSKPVKINNYDTTDEGPFACTFNGKIYLFWKANASRSNNYIYYSIMNDEGGFPIGRKINDRDQSDNTSRAVEFNGILYIFWKDNSDSNRIWMSFLNPLGVWVDGVHILEGSLTANPVMPCVYDGKLYLFWRSYENGDEIFFSESHDAKNWSKAAVTNATLNSPIDPGCVVFNNRIYIFCGQKGAYDNVIYSMAGNADMAS